MTSKILISLSLLVLFAGQKAGAQLLPPDDFFNSGAQLYISSTVPAALERVESGLKTYPDDAKLKKLEQLLKQQQQQQNQQQNQQKQDQQQQQQKDQQQKNQQDQQSQQNSQDQQKSDQQKQDEQKQKEAEQKKEEQQKQQEQQAAAQKKDDEKKDKPDTEGQAVKAGQMTPEEAKRLLEAQKGDKQLFKMKPQEKPRNVSRPVKDW